MRGQLVRAHLVPMAVPPYGTDHVHPPWCAEPVAPAVEPSAPPAPSFPREGEGDGASTVGGTTFEVPGHLSFLRLLGRGSYGVVCAFQDAQAGREVAIKKIPNPCRTAVDGKRCLREIKLLRILEHPGILSLYDILPLPSPDFEGVYLITEIMDGDLHGVITSGEYTDEHVQFFVYSILQALLYLHSANIVHRDLKPLNVLVNKDVTTKLCDFGLARGRAGFSLEDDDFLRTEYVGTRWYRAPEIVLTSMEYTAAVDIWSVGCIMAELIGRRPVFRGTDFIDQIRSICAVLGTPKDEELSFIPEANQAARSFVKTRFPGLPKQSWAALLPDASPQQCELLDLTLHFDPNMRLPALDALRHAYFEDLHGPEEELVAGEHVDWSFDDVDNNPSTMQCLIYHEAAALHPEILQRDREELARRGWLEVPLVGPSKLVAQALDPVAATAAAAAAEAAEAAEAVAA